jgi:hypothetical protein
MNIKHLRRFWLMGLSCLIISGCTIVYGAYECPTDLYGYGPPELNAPKGYVNPGSEIEFRWDLFCKPEEFQIEISNNPNFSNSKMLTTTGADYNSMRSITDGPYPGNEEYWWRVRYRMEDSISDWSEHAYFVTRPFCSFSDISDLTILPVTKNKTAFDHTEVQLVFHKEAIYCQPEMYHIQISRNNDFSPSVFDEVLLSTPDEYSIHIQRTSKIKLEDCQDYYWRVAFSDNGEDGPFTESRIFRVQSPDCEPYICPEADLPKPSSCIPGSDRMADSITPTLKWYVPPYCVPEGYLVHLSKGVELIEGQYDLLTADDHFYSFDFEPLDPASYYTWRVAAKAGDVVGPWSFDRTFRTPPSCTSSSDLLAPTILSPEDFASIDQNLVEFHLDWSHMECFPSGYRVELSTDPEFGPEAEHNPGLFEYRPELSYEYLHDCTRYYWRTRAIAFGSLGPWSETRTFFVDYSTSCISSEVTTPSLKGIKNTACREGPGDDFPLVSYFRVDQAATLVARDIENLWWIIENPTGDDGICWVGQADTKLFGNAADLPIFQPPQPVYSPSRNDGGSSPVCNGYLGQSQCEAAGGTYKLSSSPPCTCP